MRTTRVAAVMMSTVALAAAGCGSATKAPTAGSVPAASLDTGGTMTMLVPSNPGNLDPLTTVTTVTLNLDGLVYDPLVHETTSGSIVSGLADHWQQAGTTWTFHMRPGVTCGDGSPMTASTVAANLSFVADPKNNSPLLGATLPAGVKATGDDNASTVTVQLAGPAPFFLQDLSDLDIVCAKGLADPASIAQASDGSGPYVLAHSVAGQQYTFTLRHGYDWGPGGASTSAPGMPATVVVRIVSNETTAANLLLQGQANLAPVVGAENKVLRAAGLFQQSGIGPLGELWFNHAAGHAEQDPNVRKALVMALDTAQVGGVLAQGQGAPPTGLVTVSPKPCSANTVAGNVPAYNVAAAGRLLDSDGWTMGPGGVRTKDGKQLTVTLLYATDTGGDPSDAFQLAAQEWAKIGVKARIQGNTTSGVENAVFSTGVWDVVNLPLGVSDPSQAVPFLSGPTAPKGENFSGIDNADYNRLTATAATATGSSGCGQWDQGEEALFRAADVIPFENETLPTWGKHVTFSMVAGSIVATSLRLEKA